MPQQLTLHTEEFSCLSLSSYQKLRGELYWPQFPPSHMGARKDFVPGLLDHLLMSYVSSTETVPSTKTRGELGVVYWLDSFVSAQSCSQSSFLI